MKRFKKRAPVLAIAALLLVVFVGGTFAYFSQTSSASNFLEAKAYDSTLTESFTPPEDGNFTPGVAVAKAVGIENTGDVGMLVRIKYEEFWTVAGLRTPVVLTYADAVGGYYDGDAESDSYVAKLAGNTSFNSNGNWVYGGDGYYYFTDELAPGEVTDKFIESIMLKESSMSETTSYDVVFWDATLQTYTTVERFTSETAIQTALTTLGGSSYVSSKVVNTTIAFDQLGSYELTFSVDTVQAVSDAADGWTTPTTTAVTTFLGNVGAGVTTVTP